MIDIKNPEFFINIPHIPTETSVEYEAFFERELEKIEYGVTIDGVYIHGWLYWHLNHWQTYIDYKDKANQVKSNFTNPEFRDNEWLIAEHLKKAEDLQKGLMLFGTRRFAKSEFEASYIGRSATLYEGSQNVIAGSNNVDIAIITSKIDKGMSGLHPYIRFDKLKFNWEKEVSFGQEEKKKGGRRFEWSKILIRNFEEGRNTEALAGLTPKSLIADEVGKTKFLEALRAAQPSLSSRFGWRTIPILTGTGGQFTPNSDAEKLFNNPDLLNFLALEIPNKKKKVGIFISGTYRMEAKVETTFSKWYENKNGIVLPKNSEIGNFKFYESDEEKAKQIIEEEIKQAEDANDVTGALKLKMYFPLNPEDCFLSEDVNDFPVEAIRQQLAYLERNDRGKPVKLIKDLTGKVGFTYNTKLKPVMEWPVTVNTDKNAPVIIYEPPMDNPSHFLYIGGSDPYNTGKSVTSESLGTFYIYKRIYDLVEGTCQQEIVASYASRPAEMKEWHQTVENLLDLYNATCMIENVGTNFIEYLKNKNRDYLLADGYNLLKQISPNSKSQQTKGLPPTPNVIRHCMNLLYEYCKEELEGVDELGNSIKRLGVSRIPDKMLLIEMLNYHKEGNYDRIVGFRHVLAYDSHLMRISPIVKYNTDPPKKPEIHRSSSPFILKPQSSFQIKRNNSPFNIR